MKVSLKGLLVPDWATDSSFCRHCGNIIYNTRSGGWFHAVDPVAGEKSCKTTHPSTIAEPGGFVKKYLKLTI